MRGGGEWQIQHEAKLSAVFATRSHPECCILSYSMTIRAFTDLLVLRGRISKYFCSDGSGAMLLGRLVL